MSSELKVPDIGDFKDVEIIEILVKEGQKVSKNDPLITLESDKSSVEVPSSLDGTIQKLNVKIGDKVSQGSIIGLIDNGSNEVNEKNNSEKKANVSDSNSQNFITVPDIGDFKNVEIIEVLVKEGDEINKGDPVITLESDKSSMEVPSDVSGKIVSLKVKIGDKVSKGDILAELSGSNQIGQVEIKKEITQNMQSNGQAQANQHQSETKRIEIKHEGVFGSNPDIADIDPEETDEWIESLNSVVKRDGSRRAHFLLSKLINQAYVSGSNLPFTQNTPYINTIPPQLETKSPGDQNIEKSIRSLIRWNAATMVVRANKISPELGGHIATFASAATLYDVGCNHFWRGKTNDFLGDMIYFQGHAAPGMYARSYLEGRISEQQLINFRQEANIKRGEGLSSYPHPWLMPDYWQFPTVSMGLGPITSIYNARFMKYMENRNLIPKQGRKIWTFMGDGECDEPESLGAIGLAARENLDNLIFVINCNLQRLDGPVRGNGKIIQELEGTFRGAGWNVLKVIWGSYWDPLLQADKTGLLMKRMDECVDGEYQAFKAKGGKYVREKFFGKYPELKQLVSNLTDEDIWRLNRGGHDPHKVYAAYDAAMKHKGQPTVILTKTIKGYGMGKSGESINTTHQQKKLGLDDMYYFRDRFDIPLTDKQVENLEFYRPDEKSDEIQYLKERRAALGGFIPSRSSNSKQIKISDPSIFESSMKSSGERELSTTMALVAILGKIFRDKEVAPKLVPIIPDEARTFGMEGFFQKVGIYAHEGQKYEPVDSEQLSSYREDQSGQVLEEGITEAGAMSSFIAAGTSYTNHDVEMIPFYIFYSMFGFQRVMDLAWAAGDSQARGFLIGATSGRTTLAGEGLQHQDGQGLIMASMIPNCISYDPTYAYEMATIVEDGIKRMHENKENIFYYVTALNENYKHPEIPSHVKKEDILKGMYLFKEFRNKGKTTVQLFGSGSILNETIKAAQILSEDFGIDSDVWSITSYSEIQREGAETLRWNQLHPDKDPRKTYIEKCLEGRSGPIIAASDYIRSHVDQIRPYIKTNFLTLGTDGYGRSDTRKELRKFFEVNKESIVVNTLSTLSKEQKIASKVVKDTIKKYNIDPDKPYPVKL
ncbi:MAG: pyruvate dehydrogenase (acetyl-transferring), homodimeric type [Pelagibacteraceae bacterium]|nr:pyruvate dehydrogenase (acetyl-transferring), homodimeric type [Pelagibacteraceae bacterium]MCI5079608.1 pyruvate dehydrogenase (acetyl-transferring), homodimeric type [Pelagibacteraceae bacterium]